MTPAAGTQMTPLLNDARDVALLSLSETPPDLEIENLRRRGIDILKISWAGQRQRKSWLSWLGLGPRSGTPSFACKLTFADNTLRLEKPRAKGDGLDVMSLAFADVRSVRVAAETDQANAQLQLETTSGTVSVPAPVMKESLIWLRDRIIMETAGLAWRPIHHVGKRTTRHTVNPDEQPYLRWQSGPSKLIRLFLEHAPARMEKLQAAATDGDLASVRQNAHWLKSSSAAVGAAYLSELVQRLEIDIDIKRDTDLSALTAHIGAEFNQVVEALTKLEGTDRDCGTVPHAPTVAAPMQTVSNVALPAGLRVLLVEDSLVNQELAKDCLEQAGCAVTVASDGREGLELFCVQSFDIVLMDCQMSGMDGFHATKSIRQFEARTGRPRAPIIALTAHALMGDRDLCLTAGMDDYLTKPFAAADLLGKLAAWAPVSEPQSPALPDTPEASGEDGTSPVEILPDEILPDEAPPASESLDAAGPIQSPTAA